MDFKSIANAALNQAAGKSDLPLSADSMGMLNELVSKGMFKDKADFVQFAIKAFMMYKSGGGSEQPTTAGVTDILGKIGIPGGASASDPDIQGKLVPLLTSAFLAAGKNKMGF